MTIPKSAPTREKWSRCRNCHGTLLACTGLTRDRGHGCCPNCDHTPQENHDATE